DRRRAAVAALLAHHLAAAAAGDPGGDTVLQHPDLRRLPTRLRADRRRASQRDATLRHLRLSGRRRHGALEPGRGYLARHVPGAADRRHRAAPLHPAGRGPLSHDRRGEVATLGLFLYPPHHFHRLAALPVLLDGGDVGPPRPRALPAVDGTQLHAVLDRASDARPHHRP